MVSGLQYQQTLGKATMTVIIQNSVANVVAPAAGFMSLATSLSVDFGKNLMKFFELPRREGCIACIR